MDIRKGLDDALNGAGETMDPATRRGLRFIASAVDDHRNETEAVIEDLRKEAKAVRTLMFSMAATIVIALVGAAIKILLGG